MLLHALKVEKKKKQKKNIRDTMYSDYIKLRCEYSNG